MQELDSPQQSEPATSTTDEGVRVGATASDLPQKFDDTNEASDTRDHLPQIVWLRGDEPLCDEFTVDADHAMALLGIRRTRLTQISGRELRVGRMRQGRYIRPMYRRRDIDLYLQNARAPATHQNSAKLVNDATEQLRIALKDFASQGIDLVEQNRHDNDKLTNRLDNILSTRLDHHSRNLISLVTEVISHIREIEGGTGKLLSNLQNLSDNIDHARRDQNQEIADLMTKLLVTVAEERKHAHDVRQDIVKLWQAGEKAFAHLRDRVDTVIDQSSSPAPPSPRHRPVPCKRILSRPCERKGRSKEFSNRRALRTYISRPVQKVSR